MERTKQKLAEAAFAADDLRLFLDTHPTDARARSDYRTAAERTARLKKELPYAVNAMDAGEGCGWDWVESPWPWEKEE